MAHYRKMIAAIVGVGILLINRHTGVDLSSESVVIVDGLVALGTVVGVWGVRND